MNVGFAVYIVGENSARLLSERVWLGRGAALRLEIWQSHVAGLASLEEPWMMPGRNFEQKEIYFSLCVDRKKDDKSPVWYKLYALWLVYTKS